MGSADSPDELVEHGGAVLPRREARWLVFLESCGHQWAYDARGFFRDKASEPYNPQLRIHSSGLVYLTVQSEDDQGYYSGTRTVVQGVPQDLLFLAIGEPQLYGDGWRDSLSSRGVHSLTPGREWEDLYPPWRDNVVHALRQAREAVFPPAVSGQQRRRAGKPRRWAEGGATE